MIKTNQPKVILLSCNKHQLQLITYAWDIMHKELSDWQDYKAKTPLSTLVKKLEPIKNSPHQTVLELIHFVFLIQNVSRAFTHQLVRHRLASYIQQSLRIVDMGKFADNGAYTMPDGLNDEMQKFVDNNMKVIQLSYNTMINKKCKVEQARALLPQNVHTQIIVGINYRSLAHMLKLRIKPDVQSEFRVVADLILDRLQEVHPFLKQFIIGDDKK